MDEGSQTPLFGAPRLTAFLLYADEVISMRQCGAGPHLLLPGPASSQWQLSDRIAAPCRARGPFFLSICAFPTRLLALLVHLGFLRVR